MGRNPTGNKMEHSRRGNNCTTSHIHTGNNIVSKVAEQKSYSQGKKGLSEVMGIC